MENLESLKEKLNETHEWPGLYTFKCVVPATQRQAFLESFPGQTPLERSSRTGKYISMTLEWRADSADEVIAVYRKASAIPGALLL